MKRIRSILVLPLLAGLLLTATVPLTGTAHANGMPNPYGVPHCQGPIFMATVPGPVPHPPMGRSWLCSDSQYYRQGSFVTICYDVPYPGTFVDFELHLPSGQTEYLDYGYDDGTGDCHQGIAWGIGWRTVTLSFGYGPPMSLSYYVG